MSDYAREHDFSVKDALSSGDAAKLIKGSEVDAEFDALLTAVNSKHDGTIAVANGGTGSTSAAAAATALGVGTGDSPQFTALNVGAATDTTVARVGAGVISVEGDTVATIANTHTWTAAQRGTVTALTSATTVTIDMAVSNNFSCTMGHNIAFANTSNNTAGQSGSIFLTQDGTGSRTASFGTDFDFAGGTAPTLTTTAAAVDRIDYIIKGADDIHAVATLAYS
jgi:hypothetical protein